MYDHDPQAVDEETKGNNEEDGENGQAAPHRLQEDDEASPKKKTKQQRRRHQQQPAAASKDDQRKIKATKAITHRMARAMTDNSHGEMEEEQLSETSMTDDIEERPGALPIRGMGRHGMARSSVTEDGTVVYDMGGEIRGGGGGPSSERNNHHLYRHEENDTSQET